MRRVVVDTNIFISGLLFKSPLAREILENWRSNSFLLITSQPLLQELVEVLERFQYPYVKELCSFIYDRACIVTPKMSLRVVRDAKDNILLEAALEGAADHIVTDDKDLLVIEEYKGIIITKAGPFLKLLSRK